MPKDKSLESVQYTLVSDEVTLLKERIVVEFDLSIIVNGKHFVTALITPMMLEEFVIGHLFGRGIIDNINEIDSLAIVENTANVKIRDKKVKYFDLPVILSDLKVSVDDIYYGVNSILKSKIYEETKAVHSAGLFKQGRETICVVEDVGRHNALDKIIGYALLNKIDLKHTFATSTGRMVSDMVSKVCRANIPIVATKTAVTKLGVEIGERCGLTIIGFVRDVGAKVTTDTGIEISAKREMRIYTNPYRILY